MSQLEIWVIIAQTALNYIFVQVITANNQKATVTDLKTDLRTTKEDLMSELKDSRENLLRESEISTKAIIEIVTAEVQKEMKPEISNKEIMDILTSKMEIEMRRIADKHGDK